MGVEASFRGYASPTELDLLIHELSVPQKCKTLSEQPSYLCFYVPTIKVEYNLCLVISSFLASPLKQSYTARDLSFIIDAFRSFTSTKARVSNPTLPLRTFYTAVLETCARQLGRCKLGTEWKILAAITGMICEELEVYGRSYFPQTWELTGDGLLQDLVAHAYTDAATRSFRHSATLCLAQVCRASPHRRRIISNKLALTVYVDVMDMLFGKNHDSLSNYAQTISEEEPPWVLSHASMLSLLAKTCLGKISIFDRAIVVNSLDKLQEFNRDMGSWAASQPQPSAGLHANPYLKTILYAQAVIFHGMMFLVGGIPNSESCYICFGIIDCFHKTRFIAMAAGSFELLDYLTAIAIDTTLKDPRQLESILLQYVEESLSRRTSSSQDSIVASQLTFALDLWEVYLRQPVWNDVLVTNELFPACMLIVESTDFFNDIAVDEAAHCVLILCLSSPRLLFSGKERISYVSLVFKHFPDRLNHTQLNVALTSVGKAMLTNGSSGAGEFMDAMFSHAIHTPTDLPNKHSDGSERNPRTVREAVVGAVFNLIPFVPADSFISTLDKMWQLVTASSETESAFLVDALWRVLSQLLDLNRADAAFHWWYDKNAESESRL